MCGKNKNCSCRIVLGHAFAHQPVSIYTSIHFDPCRVWWCLSPGEKVAAAVVNKKARKQIISEIRFVTFFDYINQEKGACGNYGRGLWHHHLWSCLSNMFIYDYTSPYVIICDDHIWSHMVIYDRIKDLWERGNLRASLGTLPRAMNFDDIGEIVVTCHKAR